MRKKQIAALLAAAATLFAAFPFLPAAAYSKATYEDIKNSSTEELRMQIEELNALLEENNKTLQNAEALQLDAATKRQTYLTMEALYEDTIGTMEDELLFIEKQAEKLVGDIAALQVAYDEKYEEFQDFLKMIYEEGTPNYIEIIVGASGFSDFLARIDRVRYLMGYSNTLMERLLSQKAELTEKYETQLKLAAEKQESIALYEGKQRELTEWQKENELEIQAIESEIRRLYEESDAYEDRTAVLDAEFQEMVSKLEAEENKRRAEEAERQRQAALRAEESRKAAEEAARLKALEEASRNSGFLWPVPMDENIVTSRFGTRTHPVTGKVGQMHYGIDIAADRNDPIYASKGGVVTAATYHASYGYYVMIDHLDGTSTLYAHCNTGSLKVKKGDMVNRGDQIAAVGSTGVSTGYHLHFEMRVNGNCVDPFGMYIAKPVGLSIRD